MNRNKRKCLPVNYSLTNQIKSKHHTSKRDRLTVVYHRCLSSRISSLVFGGRPAHWLSILELLLPPFDQFGGLEQVLHFVVAFSVRHSAGQGVRGLGRSTHGLPSDPRPSLTRPSALACSLENTLSCASEALRLRSYVFCHALENSLEAVAMSSQEQSSSEEPWRDHKAPWAATPMRRAACHSPNARSPTANSCR